MPVRLAEIEQGELGDLFVLLQDEVLTLQLETAEAEGGPPNATDQLPAHSHTAFVDENGNGITEPAEGHRHIVKEWTVLEALGHDHGELQREKAAEIEQTAATDRRYRTGAFELPVRLVDGEVRFDEDNLVEGKPVQVLKVGTFKHPESGEFEITEEFLDQLVDNSERFGRRIHFDYDHASEYTTDNPEQSGKAAGWVKKIFRDGDTLWAVPLWTKPAFEAIQAGEWRYISAAFRGNYTKEGNESLGPVLTSIAITNHPFLKDMEPIAANERGEYRWLLMEAAEEKNMKKLAEILGLSEDATESQIADAIKALTERATALAEAFKEALGLDEVPEDPKELVAAAERGIKRRLDDRDSQVPDGMKLVDKEQLESLERGAKQAEQATQKLTEMEARERIRELKADNRIVSKKQEEYGRQLYAEQGPEAFESWAETLDSNKELAELRQRSGHGQEPEHELSDEQQEAVKLFNDKVDEIAEQEKVSMGTAIRRAAQKYPKLAERYTAATEPQTQA